MQILQYGVESMGMELPDLVLRSSSPVVHSMVVTFTL
ncbi:hypothetical protein TNCV_5009421, partial [Trichonephila clavipes]